MSETSVGSEQERLAREIVAEVTAWPIDSFDDSDAAHMREAAGRVANLLVAREEKREAAFNLVAECLRDEQEAHAQLQARCYEGFPSASDGIFDALSEADRDRDSLRLLLKEAAGSLVRQSCSGPGQHLCDDMAAPVEREDWCRGCVARNIAARIRSVLDPEKPEIERAYRALRAQVEK